MKRVLIVGAGRGGKSLLTILTEIEHFEVVAVIDKNVQAPALQIAKNNQIPTGVNWEEWLDEDIDILIETTGSSAVLNHMLASTHPTKTVVIPGDVAYIIAKLFEEKEDLVDKLKLQTAHQEFILRNILDGMIIVDKNGLISFANPSAERTVGFSAKEWHGHSITDLIHTSRLLHVMNVKRKEVNQKLVLKNGKKVISTRIRIINESGESIGAFAVFKDITEVVNLAEENTDLKEVKTMLEAIIHSSEEAISVVDENGKGLMINPAYTRITGLSEKEVIGKPATTDISEGESMHMKVLTTGRPVRGVYMKVGPAEKDVMVNVAPINVDNHVKGSVGIIHDISEIKALTSELKRAREIIRNLEAKYTFDDIIGPSEEMQLALEQAKVGARTPATVLLRGSSGTGKELFAHAIHNESKRRHNKFIRVNCAAIAESIMESELFGYIEGAFSGAKKGGKKGLFEEAHKGSIFLDEIGELSLAMQAKLLRILQEGEIVRVGDTEPITVDVRIIAATNMNLEKAIMEKRFREDLYYRLSRLPVFIPSLKERISDIPQLVQHVIKKINHDYGRQVQGINPLAVETLKKYDWPGNVRELENIIGRAMIYMDMNDEIIEKKHLPVLKPVNKADQFSFTTVSHHLTLQNALAEYEKAYITRTYEQENQNKTQTAKALNISIRNLYYKLSKYNLA